MRIDSFEKHMKRKMRTRHGEPSLGNMRNTDMPEESLLGT
jgi:hypothetical protein